jgi:hypothetical protein
MSQGPIHTAVIDGKPLRFFWPELDEDGGGNDWAWLSFADAMSVLSIDEAKRGDTLWRLLTRGYPYISINTPDGLAGIVPHHAIRDLIVDIERSADPLPQGLCAKYIQAAIAGTFAALGEEPEGGMEMMAETSNRWPVAPAPQAISREAA